MVRPLDLGLVAEDLQRRGIDAVHDFIYGPHGCVEGLDVGDDFFPLWELNLAENAAALERADFAEIASRRRPGWNIYAPPRQQVAVG